MRSKKQGLDQTVRSATVVYDEALSIVLESSPSSGGVKGYPWEPKGHISSVGRSRDSEAYSSAYLCHIRGLDLEASDTGSLKISQDPSKCLSRSP